jgi:hypothetical protein
LSDPVRTFHEVCFISGYCNILHVPSKAFRFFIGFLLPFRDFFWRLSLPSLFNCRIFSVHIRAKGIIRFCRWFSAAILIRSGM